MGVIRVVLPNFLKVVPGIYQRGGDGFLLFYAILDADTSLHAFKKFKFFVGQNSISCGEAHNLVSARKAKGP